MPKIRLTQFERDRVWRYMSFARFVWLLQNKALWLSRADLLGDKWEFPPSSARRLTALAMAAADVGPGRKFPDEAAAAASFRNFIETLRRSTYLNSWTRTPHESHAMWQIYCGGPEGVALQTTVGALYDSVPPAAEVLPVGYDPDNDPKVGFYEIATSKMPWFSYEREIRIVSLDPNDMHTVERNPVGRTIDWDPANHVEAIRLHPECDDSFFATVTTLVRMLAPTLEPGARRSDMSRMPESL